MLIGFFDGIHFNKLHLNFRMETLIIKNNIFQTFSTQNWILLLPEFFFSLPWKWLLLNFFISNTIVNEKIICFSTNFTDCLHWSNCLIFFIKIIKINHQYFKNILLYFFVDNTIIHIWQVRSNDVLTKWLNQTIFAVHIFDNFEFLLSLKEKSVICIEICM